MVTVTACDAAYTEKALKRLADLAADLRARAGAISTHHGVVVTGQHTGCLVLFQAYESLSGVDQAFAVYADSDDYRAVIAAGRLKVGFRNIIKLEDVNLPQSSRDNPTCGVVTRWSSAKLEPDGMDEIVKISGHRSATMLHYGTLFTGENVGKRLLVVGYPSMEAIEEAYDALLTSDVYDGFLKNVTIDMRNIIRFRV